MPCITNIDNNTAATAICPTNDKLITLLLDDNTQPLITRMTWLDFKTCASKVNTLQTVTDNYNYTSTSFYLIDGISGETTIGITNDGLGNGELTVKNAGNPSITLYGIDGKIEFVGPLSPNNDPGTTGQILISAGASAPPTWVTQTIVSSGTYLPTLTSGSNVASSSITTCQYIRVGNVVTVSGRVDIAGSVGANTYTSIGMTCPITPNFTTCNEAGGTGSVFQDTTKLTGGFLADCADGAKIAFSFYAPDTASHNFSFSFTYKIA